MDALRRQFGERLRAVVLFGSQARGEATLASDHDLFVVADDLPPDPMARARMLGLFAGSPGVARLPFSISIVARTPEEVAARLTPLLIDICADGVCLYGADYFDSLCRKALAAVEAAGLYRRRVGGTLMWVFPQARTTNWRLEWDGFHDGG